MFHSLVIKNIRPETIAAASITLSIPTSLADTFRYVAGQYLTLQIMLEGKEVRRAYSISSSPTLANDEVTITIKRVKGGLVSNYLLDTLRVGDTLAVMPPEGRFYTPLAIEQRKSYYMLAAGSGITPLMAMIRSIVEQEPQSVIYLLYSNRDEDHIIFRADLEALERRYEGQLHVEYLLSQPKKEKEGGLRGLFKKPTTQWQGKTGRIDDTTLTEFLEKYPSPNKAIEYFICGPEGMIDRAEETLQARGINKKNIHKEYFSTTTPTDAVSHAVGAATLRATLDGVVLTVPIAAHQTVLQALIAQKHEPPYSCTTGACSTCIAKVTAGTVKMDVCHALDEDEIKAGYVLTCQARATSPEVALSYDV